MKNNANEATKKLTLRQLKEMLPSTQGKNIPRVNDLRENEQVVVRTQMDGCEMTVFSNGFALYQNECHYTILRMEHVGKARYYSEAEDKRETIPVEDEEWTVGVMVCGEDRIEDRYQIKAEQRLTSMFTESDDGEWEEREFDSGEDFVEEYIAKVEREAAKEAVEKLLSSSPSSKPTVIYICSPYRPVFKTEADRKSELEANIERAKAACKMVVALGCMPLAPHIYFTQFLNDRDPVDREKGMALGLQWLEQSDELWIFGNTVSDGMAAEIARAKELGMPVRCIPEPCRAVEMLLREILGDENNAGEHNAGDNKANAKKESEDKHNG